VPELMQLDGQGYPIMLDMPVPPWLERQAWRAVDMCPELALRLVPADLDSLAGGGSPARRPDQPGLMLRADREPTADTAPDLAVSEDWIAEISSVRRAISPPQRPAGR
jgi:hypothetical protein